MIKAENFIYVVYDEEGKRKLETAKKVLEELRESINKIIVLDTYDEHLSECIDLLDDVLNKKPIW